MWHVIEFLFFNSLKPAFDMVAFGEGSLTVTSKYVKYRY